MSSLAEQNWAFALRLYAEPGVAAACLRLQNEAGVDVMLLLTVAFATRRGIALSPSDIAAMNNTCRPWRENIVQPLRALRVALKAGPPPAPNAASDELRNQIKASELHAERLQSDLLAEWLQQGVIANCFAERTGLRWALREVLTLTRPAVLSDLEPEIETIALAAELIAA